MLTNSTARLVTALSLLCCLAGQASDWPQYRGPKRDGISDEKGWLTEWPDNGPKRMWKASVGIGSSGIAIAAGHLYTMGHDNGTDTVYCLNADTGAEIWKHSYPCDTFDNMHEGGPSSTPTVDGTQVYTQSRAGDLFCLDAASGKVIWKVQFDSLKGVVPMFGWSASPLALEDRLIISVGGPGVSRVAFDKKTGKVLWKAGDDDTSYASPLELEVSKQPRVAIFNASGLVLTNPADGAETGRYEWVTPSPINSRINAATPSISGARIFIGSGYGKGCALLDFSAGNAAPKVLWENENLRPQYGSPVLLGEYIYGFDSNPDGSDRQGNLKCLDLKTGEEKWVRKDPALGTLTAADGKLLILSRRGELIAAEASPAQYKELARAQVVGGTCRTEPVLSNGRIYVRSVKGELICLDVKK